MGDESITSGNGSGHAASDAPPPPRGMGVGTDSDRVFRKLVQNSSDITLVVGADTIIHWVSPALQGVLGYDPAEWQGRSAAELVHPDDLPLALDQLDALAGGRPTQSGSVAIRVRHRDGSWRHMGIVGTDLTDDPDVGGVLLNLRDISGRVAAQDASDRLVTIVENTSDLVLILDHGRLSYMNTAGRSFLGLHPSTPLDEVDPFHFLPTWVQHTWTAEVIPRLRTAGIWSGELAALGQDGRPVPLSVVVVAHTGPDGAIDVVSAVARDMSERKAFEERLEHQATHDPLTGLPNRTLLLDRLHVALGRAARSRRYAAVLFLDLDHFKVVNDSLGHDAGDALLVTVAERLATALRPGDTVARFGGDEFVVLCEDLNSRDEARTIADRVAAAVGDPMVLGDTEVYVTPSIGIAVADGPTSDPGELVRDADAAMYQAKQRGRSRTEVFDRTMREHAVDRLELEAALRRAIERRELRLVYQPVVDTASGTVVAFEALLRWEHPERGLLRPDDFLGVAEESRLILPIGAWVVRQACGVFARARQVVPGDRPLSVAVNLSARQLMHVGLAAEIGEILAELGVSARSVVFEITEGVLMDDIGASQANLAGLQALGARIAIDDFGTGYSSMAHLRRFPVDLLKIDRTFVAGLGTDPGDTAIVAAVVNLAHNLGMEAIAEGVENTDQLDALVALGCEMTQGHLVGRPMGDAALVELLSGAAARPADATD